MRVVRLGPEIEHANVTMFQRAYHSPHSVYVFEELASGGDLFSLVHRSGEFKSLEVRWMLWQILQGLQYLHGRAIAHRDMKIENILCMVCPRAAHRLAITDLGHAGRMNKGRRNSVCGTIGLQAPEQLTRDRYHDLAVDMWAIGIIAVQLLAGSTILHSLDGDDLAEKLAEDPPTIDLDSIFSELHSANIHRSQEDSELGREPIDRTVSECAKDFISCCLTIDEEERMTASEALEHPWMNGHDVLELFRTRYEQTSKGHSCEVQDDPIQELHDVLNPPKEDHPQNMIRPVSSMRENRPTPLVASFEGVMDTPSTLPGSFIRSPGDVGSSCVDKDEKVEDSHERKRTISEISMEADVTKSSKRQRDSGFDKDEFLEDTS